jgi:hypothetical protein
MAEHWALSVAAALTTLVTAATCIPFTNVDVAAYVFDPWTHDPTLYHDHGPNWTEWELVKAAKPRFPGHTQPHVPLWGYINTALPATWDLLNENALSHGVNVYLWDFYWWQTAPVNPLLMRGLEEGFFTAPTSSKMKWAIMWANQDWSDDLFPARRNRPLQTMYSGAMNAATFANMTQYWIDKYLSRSNYYRVPSAVNASCLCPLVSVYLLKDLVDGLGGIVSATEAISDFRARAMLAGIPCVHLQAQGVGVRPWGSAISARLAALGIDSVTDYCWQHYQPMPDFPLTAYAPYAAASMLQYAELAAAVAPVHYVPTFSVAWDPTPRVVGTDAFTLGPYPFTAILQPTVSEIQEALAAAGAYAASNCRGAWCMLTIYAFSEFSEGGTLWPTVADGYGRLQAVQAVFGNRSTEF